MTPERRAEIRERWRGVLPWDAVRLRALLRFAGKNDSVWYDNPDENVFLPNQDDAERIAAAFEDVTSLLAALDEREQQIAAVGEALERSVALQSLYAMLLNSYDGGERMEFSSAQAWLDRLAALDPASKKDEL